ncbi:MAG: hypothetical protein ING19_06435 [Azospirillum sp.]|nr:hypothetical protein [Azospirillum sp.]
MPVTRRFLADAFGNGAPLAAGLEMKWRGDGVEGIVVVEDDSFSLAVAAIGNDARILELRIVGDFSPDAQTPLIVETAKLEGETVDDFQSVVAVFALLRPRMTPQTSAKTGFAEENRRLEV